MADGSALKASLTLKLEDLISPGLKTLLDRLTQLQGVAKKLNLNPLAQSAQAVPAATQQVSLLSRAIGGIVGAAGRAEAAMARLWRGVRSGAAGAAGAVKSVSERIGIIGGAVAGVGLMGPIRKAADYDFTLRHIAITEGLSGTAAETEIKRLGKMFNKEALETGQSSHSIAAAFIDLVQAGMTPELAEKLIPIHSRAATAYGISPEELGHAVFALGKTLGIGEAEMPAALGGMAQASKEGLFKVKDFSSYLTGQAGIGAPLGLHGLQGAATLFALNEVVAQRTTTAEQAGQYVAAGLGYISSPTAEHHFQRAGINLPESLKKGVAGGLDEVEAFIRILERATKGMTGVDRNRMLGKLIANQEDMRVWQAVLDMRQEYNERRQRYGHGDPTRPATDFETAFAGFRAQTDLFEENITQIARVFGVGFVPVLRSINDLLKGFNEQLQAFQQANPELTANILLGVGAFLALVTVLGVLGVALPAIGAGFALLFSPVMLVVGAVAAVAYGAYEIYRTWGDVAAWFGRQVTAVKGWIDELSLFQVVLLGLGTGFALALSPILLVGAAIAAVAYGAYEIYRNWGDVAAWFGRQWEAVKGWFSGFGTWVTAWAGGELRAGVQAIKDAFAGLEAWFSRLWTRITGPFQYLLDLIDHLPGLGSAAPPSGRTSALPGSDAPPPTGSRGGFIGPGGNPIDPTLAPEVTVNFANAPPGTTVTASPGVRIGNLHLADPPDRGQVLGRP